MINLNEEQKIDTLVKDVCDARRRAWEKTKKSDAYKNFEQTLVNDSTYKQLKDNVEKFESFKKLAEELSQKSALLVGAPIEKEKGWITLDCSWFYDPAEKNLREPDSYLKDYISFKRDEAFPQPEYCYSDVKQEVCRNLLQQQKEFSYDKLVESMV